MQLGRHIRALIPPSPIARRFLPCALVLGFLFSVVNPPFAVNDERHHWLRALDLTKGRLITRSDERGAFITIQTYYFDDLIMRYATLANHEGDRVDAAQLLRDLTTRHKPPSTGRTRWKRTGAQAGAYSPLPYLPHLLPIGFARALQLPALWQIYLSRFSSVLCYALLSAWAIAFAGELGWVLFVLALMPMSLTQAAGLSGDGVTNGLSFIFFALVARGTLRAGATLSRRELWWLAVLGALLALCKAPYALLSLVLFALRWEGARTGWRRLGYAAGVLAGAAASYSLWSYLNRGGPSAGPSALDTQLSWLAEDWLNGPRLLGNTLLTSVDDYLIELVAVRDLLHRQLRFLGGVVTGTYLLLLGAVSWGVCLPHQLEPATRRRALLWLPLAALAVSGTVFAAMFLMATPVGSPLVLGIQGRYFIPLMPALLFTLGLFGRPSLSRWLSRHGAVRMVSMIAVLNVLCMCGLIARYYGSASIDWPY
jgi:Predicted membrane protein (DUF2142)